VSASRRVGEDEVKDVLEAEIECKFQRGRRFADDKGKVIDPPARVTTVSVRTVAIVNAMKEANR
jgi:hypothetical protein